MADFKSSRRRRIKNSEGGESGSGSGSVPLAESASDLRVAREPSDFGRLFFADPEFVLPSQQRQMTEKQFLVGVRHHWAPLLASVQRRSAEGENPLR